MVVVGDFSVRGGITTTVTVSYEKPEDTSKGSRTSA
jgi:NADPH-dependent 7-cyano-7-deazaguanine reductase QueF